MVSLIVKPTNRCNAACLYCNSAVDEGAQCRTMEDATLVRLFERIDEFLSERPDQRMIVLWHGGEPLLMGPAFFERVAEVQKATCGATEERIAHRIQTNLTLFSRRFAGPLRALGIYGLGTSYEPLPGLRGLGRAHDWQAYQESFGRAVAVLEAERFGWGLIHVVTRPALGRAAEIYRELTALKGDGNITFHAVSPPPGDPDRLAITPAEFAAFLGEVLALWWPEREGRPHVEPFRSLLRTLGEGRPSLYCKEAGRCAENDFGIEPDGTIAQCGRASDRHVLAYGTIFERSFSNVLSDPARRALADRQGRLREGDCAGCRFWPICHGGCPLDSWDATGDFMGRTGWCEAKRLFMEQHFEPVTGLRCEGDVGCRS